jgi:hypothetical protein
MGIDGITHILVNNAKQLPAERRAEYQAIRGGRFMYDWFRYADFDGPEIKAMIAALVANRITIDPTLVAFEWLAHANDTTYFPKEVAQYVPPTLMAKALQAGSKGLGWSDEEFRNAQQQVERMLELTRRLHEAGIVLTIGTDGANPWLYHRELELMAKAGIPNAEVIRMATRNAAISLGRTSEFGTVEVGRRADLVVLDADPIADIKNTRRIAWVIHDGQLNRPEDHLPARLRGKSR